MRTTNTLETPSHLDHLKCCQSPRLSLYQKKLASISSLQSSLAEYAGGVARDSKGLVVGRLAGGKLEQLLRPRFADPKLEREYRSIAYGSHRGFRGR